MKVICAVLFLFFQTLFCVFSKTGIGFQGGYDFSSRPAWFVSVTARSDLYPWVVSMNAYPQKNMISVFADDYFVNETFTPLSKNIDYYLFWGVSAGFLSDDGLIEASTGCRFGGGLDFFFLQRHVSFFCRGAWNPYFGAKKTDGNWKGLARPLSFPCSAGVRVWF